MKKILASCLTCCTLLGSMCFSSPMAQLHAMSTEGGTGSTTEKYDHDIELDLWEEIENSSYEIQNLPKNSIFSITGLPAGAYKCTSVSGEVKRVEKPTNEKSVFEFEIGNTDEHQAGSIELERIDPTSRITKTYTIKLYDLATERTSETETGDIQKYTFSLDLPLTKSYSSIDDVAIHYTPKNKNINFQGFSAEVKPGDTFRFNLPDYFIKDENFSSKYLELGKNARHDYIIWDKIDQEEIYTSLTGKISDDAKPRETVLFDIDARISYTPMAMGDDTTTLVTYNSDPGDGDEIPIYSIPVEFKIADDGKGDIIDDGEEEPVFLILTPEYKKLTSKGETYKLDASVELDEDADPEAKESFEAMKKDGHFKVSFMSKNTDVATVSEDGTVTAVANGSTEIVAYVKGFEEEGLIATSKVDVEIAEKVEEEPEEADTTYPKTGDNFMAISAAILTLGFSALVVALMSKKQQQEDVNEEK